LAFLSVAAFLCAGIAFVFLTSAGGLWPMPQVSTTLHLPVIDNPKTAVSVGSVSALVAGLLVIAAWGWRRRVLRYRHLLRSLEIDPDGRVITAPRGNVVYSNAALDVMLGEANAARFKALGNLADLGAEAERLSALLALATAGSSGHTEIFLGTPGDVRRRLKVSAYPLHSWRGHVLWCIEDITARHQMEQALREERGKLVDFLEKAAMGFYAVDAQGRFVYANHAFADWLGLTPAELIQPERRLGNVISGSADPERPYMPFPPGHTGDRGEVTLKRKDGSEFPVEIIQTVSGDAGEGTFVTRSVVRDLTTERELEEIRHQSEQRFRKLFEDSPTGIAILDLDGTATLPAPIPWA
jgi:two-component system cell cycle sensor histidine kinase/response regulator CckA